MPIPDHNPYDLPLDEPELLNALLLVLSTDALNWLMAHGEAERERYAAELRRRRSQHEN